MSTEDEVTLQILWELRKMLSLQRDIMTIFTSYDLVTESLRPTTREEVDKFFDKKAGKDKAQINRERPEYKNSTAFASVEGWATGLD